MALKELEARYATKRAKDYKLADGEGLYLLVRASGSKLWRFKYRFAGKEAARFWRLTRGQSGCRAPAACRGKGDARAGQGPFDGVSIIEKDLLVVAATFIMPVPTISG
ncbi:Arm DNA-binding domain-containing protein [Sphingomonas sp. 1P08PE]|uniref:Arm DNA-binding domain-containing protein n=1 Tax=Sphingomonas sp. 1P08PE TaxID=554122 RepID=UPI0039A360E8